jgi:hypothetical protein
MVQLANNFLQSQKHLILLGDDRLFKQKERLFICF